MLFTNNEPQSIETGRPLSEVPKSEIESRRQLTQKLSRLLGDTCQTYFRTLNYHWNIEGPMFYGVHKLLEEHYKDMGGALDDIAERIRMLGEESPGSLSAFQSLTQITDRNEDGTPSASSSMIRQLISDHEKTIAMAKDTIELADQVRDYGTADLVTVRLRFHEKAVWMLRSLVSSATLSN